MRGAPGTGATLRRPSGSGATLRRPPSARVGPLAAAGAPLVAALAVVVWLLPVGGGGSAAPGPPLVEVRVVPAVGPAEVSTGFVQRRGRVITVAHALSGRNVRVLVRSGRGRPRPARVLRIDRRADLALLAVSRQVVTGTSSPGSDEPHLLVRRSSQPAALAVEVRRRIRARIRPRPGEPFTRRPVIEIAARIRSGDSGAPLLDANGRLLGVVFARSHTREDTAYAVAAGRLAAWSAR